MIISYVSVLPSYIARVCNPGLATRFCRVRMLNRPLLNSAGRRHFSGDAVSLEHKNDDSPLYSTISSAAVFSDIGRMDLMTPRQMRVLLEDAVTAKVTDTYFWAKAAAICLKASALFKFFDALTVLECFAKTKLDDRTLVSEMASHLTTHVHRMEPRHLIQAVDVFGCFGRFPEQLFMEVFYSMIKYSEKLTGAEYAAVFRCLAQWQIRNPQLIAALSRGLCTNISILRYPELCQVAACARQMDIADEAFYLVLDEWQHKELQLMTIQELMDATKQLKSQEIKYEPYHNALFNEFVKQTKELNGTAGINQLADPFDCLNQLRLMDAVSKEFLLALTKWCEDAVHNPPTRSQKRPESHDLVNLYNMAVEYNIDMSYLDKAILKFVTSKGGLRLRSPKPIATRYKPNRKYIYAVDPEEPGKIRPPLHLPEDYIEDVPEEEAQRSVAMRAESEHIQSILDELDPLPKGVDFKKKHKPSTQSCGKASFRHKAKTTKHRNISVTQQF